MEGFARAYSLSVLRREFRTKDGQSLGIVRTATNSQLEHNVVVWCDLHQLCADIGTVGLIGGLRVDGTDGAKSDEGIAGRRQATCASLEFREKPLTCLVAVAPNLPDRSPS